MCKVRWLANEHPSVQREPWTEVERLDLQRAVREATRPLSPSSENAREEEQEVDWEVVAGLLGVESSHKTYISVNLINSNSIEWTDRCRLHEGISLFVWKGRAYSMDTRTGCGTSCSS